MKDVIQKSKDWLNEDFKGYKKKEWIAVVAIIWFLIWIIF